jgi:hypothetical protein
VRVPSEVLAGEDIVGARRQIWRFDRPKDRVHHCSLWLWPYRAAPVVDCSWFLYQTFCDFAPYQQLVCWDAPVSVLMKQYFANVNIDLCGTGYSRPRVGLATAFRSSVSNLISCAAPSICNTGPPQYFYNAPLSHYSTYLPAATQSTIPTQCVCVRVRACVCVGVRVCVCVCACVVHSTRATRRLGVAIPTQRACAPMGCGT